MEKTISKRDNKTLLTFRNVSAFFVIFYFVGLVGTLVPASRPLFINLTPFALLLSIVAIIIFHESRLSTQFLISFLTIYILGFFIEVVGVNTGLIFGEYRYGAGLGLKMFNTPFFIGINWVMLIYSSSSLLNKISLNPLFKIGATSLLMLIYDLILEQVAPFMDMWYWKGNSIPLQNYVAWFLVAIIFHLIFHLFKVNTKNKIAPVIFGIQLVFFFTLALYINLSK